MGVFPLPFLRASQQVRLPHARGGVSRQPHGEDDEQRSSPRTWGCFRRRRWRLAASIVFPTHVGVFLASKYAIVFDRGLPHARGGVSLICIWSFPVAESSPRTWGCFSWANHRCYMNPVFPTHVGVFLRAFCPRSPSPRLPHARGGVSASRPYATAFCQSSPRTWGCFCYSGDPKIGLFVFPTHVGVFLKRRIRSAFGLCLPYARGIFQKNY